MPTTQTQRAPRLNRRARLTFTAAPRPPAPPHDFLLMSLCPQLTAEAAPATPRTRRPQRRAA